MFKARAGSPGMKQKQSVISFFWRQSKGLAVVLVSALLVAGVVVAPKDVGADQFDEQIRQLQAQNADKKSSLEQLMMEATSFQDVISRLNAQIGVTAVLHTWSQTLLDHYHLHCIVYAAA